MSWFPECTTEIPDSREMSDWMVVGKVGSLGSLENIPLSAFAFLSLGSDVCLLQLEKCGSGIMGVPQEVWHETWKVETVTLVSPQWVP